MSQAFLPLDPPAGAPITWDGKLSSLLGVLTQEACDRPGRWAHRQLKHGALVAVLFGPERRRILRIARAEPPANDRARERWTAELATFRKHLGTEHWQPLPDEEGGGGVAVRYLELYLGEVEPGKARCDRCGSQVPFDPVWGKAQRCDNCARQAGDEETRAIREGRAHG